VDYKKFPELGLVQMVGSLVFDGSEVVVEPVGGPGRRLGLSFEDAVDHMSGLGRFGNVG